MAETGLSPSPPPEIEVEQNNGQHTDDQSDFIDGISSSSGVQLVDASKNGKSMAFIKY